MYARIIHQTGTTVNIRSNKHDRLRRRDLEPLAATHVAAGKHVVNPYHIVARFIEHRPVVLVHVFRRLLPLGPFYPAYIVIISFTAMWA